MTTLDRLVHEAARDLRLSPEQRYELSAAARRFAAMTDDAEIRAQAHAIATSSTNALLGGAVNLVALGLVEARRTSDMLPAEREAYEAANYTQIGANGLDDSGVADVARAIEDAEG